MGAGSNPVLVNLIFCRFLYYFYTLEIKPQFSANQFWFGFGFKIKWKAFCRAKAGSRWPDSRAAPRLSCATCCGTCCRQGVYVLRMCAWPVCLTSRLYSVEPLVLGAGLAVAGGALLRGCAVARAPTAHTALLPGAGLGAAFGAGVAITALVPAHYNWGLYVAGLSFFHWSEYMTTALFNGDRLEFDCAGVVYRCCDDDGRARHLTA